MLAAGSRKVVKWAIICGALFVAAVIAGFTIHGNGHEPAATRSGIDERVVLRDVAFTITHVRRSKRLPGYPGQGVRRWTRAKGVFIRVSIRVENVGGMPATGTISDSTFFGGNGQTDGLESSKNSSFSELRPNSSDRGWLVFDVSPEAVRGGRLVLLECAAPLLDEPTQTCATARIDLGLR